jgi:hypothetical protein
LGAENDASKCKSSRIFRPASYTVKRAGSFAQQLQAAGELLVGRSVDAASKRVRLRETQIPVDHPDACFLESVERTLIYAADCSFLALFGE